MRQRDEYKETIPRGFIYGIVGTILLCLMVSITWAFKPVWLGFEREALKNSHQYSETTERLVLDLVDEYQGLETEIAKYEANTETDTTAIVDGLRGQQASILARIKREARQTPHATPDSVQSFLRSHP